MEQSLFYAFLLPAGMGGGEAPDQFPEEAGRHKIGSVPHVLKMWFSAEPDMEQTYCFSLENVKLSVFEEG